MGWHHALFPPVEKYFAALRDGTSHSEPYAPGGIEAPIGGTPNFEAMGTANRLCRSHFAPRDANDYPSAKAHARAWFKMQRDYGHCCEKHGNTLSVETGCPRPHDRFYYYPVINMLLVGIARKDQEIIEDAADWLGREAMLGREYRTFNRTVIPAPRSDRRSLPRSIERDILTSIVHGWETAAQYDKKPRKPRIVASSPLGVFNQVFHKNKVVRDVVLLAPFPTMPYVIHKNPLTDARMRDGYEAYIDRQELVSLPHKIQVVDLCTRVVNLPNIEDCSAEW